MTDASRWQSIPTAWDHLHTQPRHQTRYPSEHAVRFLQRADLTVNRRALDIGCGQGRHSALLLEHGYEVSACDSSKEAVKRTRLSFSRDFKVDVRQATMTDLPFDDDTFGIAIAFGVFYYGTTSDHELAVTELHRVLAPGGQALVVHRTTRDSRYSKQPGLGDYRLDLPGHPEDQMIMNFLSAYGLETIYGRFSTLNYERTETTRHDRTWTDSDWLITVTK